MASYSRYLIEFLFNYWSIEEMYLWYNQLFLSQLLSRPGGKFWEIFLKKNTVTTAYNQNVIVVYTVFENISNHCGSDYLQVWLVVVQTENLF